MERSPTANDVRTLMERLRQSVHKEECWSCDCLQGFLTQLEMDAAQDVTSLTASLKVMQDEMHGCLGCCPCPPGALFAEYIRPQANP